MMPPPGALGDFATVGQAPVDAILGGMYDELTAVAGFDTAALRWDAEAYPQRLWDGDPTVFSEDEVPELADRLGWLSLHDEMQDRIPELTTLAESLVSVGILDVVVCGMGGSSLAPDVFSQVLGSRPSYPRVTVLDSTHPGAVVDVARAIDPDRSAFVISSKSGTTLETLSFFRYFWEMTGGDGSRFIAVTDPGTSLAEMGHDHGFRAVVEAPPDVGGRYSALTPFGLVPAAIMGVDLDRFLAAARRLAADSRGNDAADDPAVAMGIAWAAHAINGHDKLTLRTSPGLASFPAWMEQLVAESLGKNGRGIVPIADEPPLDVYSYDRVFVDYVLDGEELSPAPADLPSVRFELGSRYDLAAEMLRAEVATAAAGEVIGVHPFNQPDVERAKQLARAAMSGDSADDVVAPVPVAGDTFRVRLERFLDQIRPGDYLSLQAYLAPDDDVDAAAGRFRQLVGERHQCATTFGYGPRFLHSTGQLHKGGPNSGVFVQVVDRSDAIVPVPETDYTFNQVIAAQADGDYAALREADRRVLRVDVTDGGMEALLEGLV
jgi:transaldolase / glucose-6-phosphate isomerase